MYGGVAQRYCLWKLDCEPYQKGTNYYVKVISPTTGISKEVRWYKDKAHADLMPTTSKDKSLCQVFGFKDEQDKIWVIQSQYLSEKEVAEYFSNQWRFADFFNGCWYAPTDCELPPIKESQKIFLCDWLSFKANAKIRAEKMGFTKYWRD